MKSCARLALVSRLWRALVADPEAWAALYFDDQRPTLKLLNVLAAKAAGRLRALDLSCLHCPKLVDDDDDERHVVVRDDDFEEVKASVLRLAAANADTLRRLKVTTHPPSVYVMCRAVALSFLATLARALPRLEYLEVDVEYATDEVPLLVSLLRAEPPFCRHTVVRRVVRVHGSYYRAPTVSVGLLAVAAAVTHRWRSSPCMHRGSQPNTWLWCCAPPCG